MKKTRLVKKTWKVYGEDGHRQRHSFADSYLYNFSKYENDEIRIIEALNSDKTGTNEYSIFPIMMNKTPHEVDLEMEAQLSDGMFENSRYGKVEEIECEHIEMTLDEIKNVEEYGRI